MALQFGGPFEVEHPSAFGFDRQNLGVVALTHQSQKASSSVPRSRKERAPDTGNPLVAPSPTATAEQALVGVHKHYRGAKKPALVLSFRKNEHGIWTCSLGDVRIEIHDLGGEWSAYLVARKRQQLFRGATGSTPFKAAKALTEQPGWFYHGGDWRALAWVYSSIQFAGLSHVNYPDSYEIGLKSGENLHVEGKWAWQRHSERKLRIVANIKLPNNAGRSRFGTSASGKPIEPMPDLRNEISFDPDEPGKLTRKRVGSTWVFKAPEN